MAEGLLDLSCYFKRLTPSDIRKQGGCSLHKRHVDQTFPPLDMSQDTPSQELVAKDLHGKIWNFHHICRNYNHLGGLQGQGIREGAVLTLRKVNIPSSCEDESKKCPLFGVNLGYRTPSYIKVLKHEAFLGRSIEISCFSGYQDFVSELDRMFEFEGTLVSGSTGWLVTYVDRDGNKKLLGDLLWFQSREVVQKMYICPKEEVAKWNRSV